MKRLVVAYLLLLAGLTLALANTSPRHWLSAASNNSTLAFAAKALLDSVVLTDSAGTGDTYYFKLYDKATAPTCGTDTPVWTIAIKEGDAVTLSALGLMFSNGIGFCLTGGIADSDNTAAAAGVTIGLGYSGR